MPPRSLFASLNLHFCHGACCDREGPLRVGSGRPQPVVAHYWSGEEPALWRVARAGDAGDAGEAHGVSGLAMPHSERKGSARGFML
jgi:hypothetical protein